MSDFQISESTSAKLTLPPRLQRNRTAWGGSSAEVSVPPPAPARASVARFKAIEAKIRTYAKNYGH